MRWLSKHLWIYLVIYVLLVCVFAGIYSLFPDHFYHSTLKFESETEAFKYTLQEALARDIERNIAPDSLSSPSTDSWRRGGILVWDLQLQDKWIVARTTVMASALKLSPPQHFIANLDLHISTIPGINTPLSQSGRDQAGNIIVKSGYPIYYVRPIQVLDIVVHSDSVGHRDSGGGLPVSLSVLFPCRSYPDINPACIEVIERTERDLSTLTRLLSGQPAKDDRDFFRMLYFSIVTITTLGFGDLVPLTCLSRSVVMSEAFLGPVLLGFFLTAIGVRMSDTAAKTAEPSNVQQKNRPDDVDIDEAL